MVKSHWAELIFFWILFAVVSFLAYSVMSPYLTSLFLAIVFTVLFEPVHRELRKELPGRENLAAFITVIVALIVIIVPLVFLGVLMWKEVVSAYASLSHPGLLGSFDGLLGAVQGQIRFFVPSFEIQTNFASYLEGVLRWFATNLNGFFSGILSFFLQCFIIVIAMFFLYRDGKKVRDFTIRWSPLADAYDETILGKLELAISAVVKGTLVTAIAQGALVGIGFAIFGVPNPVLWGTVSTIAALIPMLGTSIITVPAAIWLMVTGHTLLGVGLIAWAGTLIGLVDNFLRPYVARKGMNLHPFLILLSVLGGLVYFGPIGFLSGPIVLAFFFALLDIYPAIVEGKTVKEDGSII